MARRRVSGRQVAVLAACGALLASVALATAAPGDDADRQRAVLTDLRAGEDAALLDLFAADSAVGRADDRVRDLQARLDTVRTSVDENRRSLQVTQDNLLAARRLLSERLEQWYRTDDIDAVEIVLASDSFADVIDQFDAIRRMTARDADVIAGAREYQTEATARQRALASQEQRVQRLVADARTEAARLEAARSAKSALLADLRQRADLTEQRITVLDRAAEEARQRAEDVAAEQTASQGSGGEPVADDGGGDAEGGVQPQAVVDAPAPASPDAPGGSLTVSATAYSIHGTTASGLPTASGVCATDPSVIPMGTQFDVPGYGTCVAADTGTAIIGNTIDVWFPSLAEAQAWGRRTVTVTLRG